MAPSRSHRFVLVLALFVVSGAAGLVDQICFSKYLSYIVGATAYAVSAVLAAFMMGLALGAHLGGRFASRVRRPLLVYGVLEVITGVAVALTPAAFETLTPYYADLARNAPTSLLPLTIGRWGVAMLIVVIPTTAMGATLPLLAGLCGTGAAPTRSGDRQRERRLGALYAVNALGGSVGALGAAYAVLGALGLSRTLGLAATASTAVGLVAILVGRHDPKGALPEPPSRRPAARSVTTHAPRWVPLLVGLAFASGTLVFATEVVFTHLLALIIGNSVYAFGLILAVFLVCLFLGAARAPRLHARYGPGALPLGLGATALALALALPLWDLLPALFTGLGDRITTFTGREIIRGVSTFGILFLPTTMMGLTFPLILQQVAVSPDVSRWVGSLTAINTIGAVVGSLGMGYVLLPALGSEWSVRLITLAFGCLAAIALVGVPAYPRRLAAVGSTAGCCFALLLPRWDLARLTSGANVYFDEQTKPGKVLFLREDVHGGVTTVVRRGGVHTLYTNGKFQGNDGWEMNAQRYFAHYPALFVEHFDRALVIGLGTGTTLGTIAAYPWRRIDVAEISPAVVEASARYFRGPNRGVLDDPRVRVMQDDGRNYLLVTQSRYDLICIELSSVWFAGASSLYSSEFYRIVRNHLTPDGRFQQWVQLHHVYTEDFATLVHTLRREFDHVALFYGGGQGVLVASSSPLQSSPSRVAALGRRPKVVATLPAGRTLDALFADVLLYDETLDQFLRESASRVGRRLESMVSTDDNLYLEYRTPRGNVLPWASRERLVHSLVRHRAPETASVLQGF